MLCVVYKSAKKSDTYLYLKKRDEFGVLPEALRTMFGTPIFVMMFSLDADKKLANADAKQVLADLESQGFYLQLPPPEENLHKAHLADLKRRGVTVDA